MDNTDVLKEWNRREEIPSNLDTSFTAAPVRPPWRQPLEHRTPTTYLGSCGYILCRRRNGSFESPFSSIDLGRTRRYAPTR